MRYLKNISDFFEKVLFLLLFLIVMLSLTYCRKYSNSALTSKDYIGDWNFTTVSYSYKHTPWGNELMSHDSVSSIGKIEMGASEKELVITIGSEIINVNLMEDGAIDCWETNYIGSGQFDGDRLLIISLWHNSNAWQGGKKIYGENPVKTEKLKFVPYVLTDSASAIAFSSVTLNGKVKANFSFTDIFFEYGLSTNYGTTVKAMSGLFSGDEEVQIGSPLTGLTPYTIYHYRIKASNSVGISYGEDQSFNSVSSTIKDIDGNIYRTIRIGTQTWMAENLKTTRYADGTPIILVSGDANWDILPVSEKAYCYYKDDIANFRIYGALYNWTATVNGGAGSSKVPSGIQGVCPTGWLIPSEGEWNVIEAYLGGQLVAGGKMMETGGAHWSVPNYATNTSGYTALPGSERSVTHSMEWGGAHFWTSTLYATNDEVYFRSVGFYTNLSGSHRSKRDGVSVRCLKD